ncbi:hypothetical protein ACQ1P2_06755 [Ornithobacterium rhinotracheale]|uniref:hypothetical protein n=1 Tax=Ornithobacterium rhinotracheale TaxID=28251 RepID=UPI001FF15924|nr:hypothetical protein [Ornithobacterium rhinotracheale]MCK0199344.1 hypothetical protein [Ornithobacterium rhinotracheale]UVD86742.1 hypothetical protein NV236_08705 [Ornithobacterium rhinotracheale]
MISSKRKKWFIGGGILAILLLISGGVYSYFDREIEAQIKTLIKENLPDNIQLDYKKLNVNLFTASFKVEEPKVYLRDKGIRVNMDVARVSGINLWEIVVNDHIDVGKIDFRGVDAEVNPMQRDTTFVKKKTPKDNLEISISKILININSFKVINQKGQQKLDLENSNLALRNLMVKTNPADEDESLKYEINDFEVDSLHVMLSKTREVSIGHLKLDSIRAFAQNVNLELKDQGVALDLGELNFHRIGLNSILRQDTIRIKRIDLKNAAVKITPSKEAAPKVDSTERENKMIWVEQFRVKNLSLNKIEEGSKLATSIGEAATYIKDIKILTQPEDGQRGFSYHLVELKAKDIVSPFKTGLHTMKIASLDMDSTNIDIKKLSIHPNYSRLEFQTHIKEQKDVIDLEIPSLSILNYKYDNENDKPMIYAEKVRLNQPDITVYRNKVTPEQTPRKPLYSEMLRKAKFGLDIPTIDIKNGKVVYEEHIDYRQKPGKIYFTNFNATITNLNNTQASNDQVLIAVNTLFMGAPTEVNWDFHIFKPADQFTISGTVKNLDPERLDTFFVHNLNAQIKGTVTWAKFNFKGNDKGAKGYMKMDFSNIEVDILTKKTKKKKKFWSTLANWLVKDDSKENEGKESKIIVVERNQQKSFFNLFWLCLKQGLVDNLL